MHLRVIVKIHGITTGFITEGLYFYSYMAIGIVSASKEGVVLFPPPIDILGKTNIF